ncbi:hypothetical protein M9Y10_036116 [Tritrichomonas musculus]|uniref:Protein kinase domain-containing protein n=1 Tax=Tritrichomonas musculus TaxID=1915356 RepID=A0ABR2GVA4_9EUKA
MINKRKIQDFQIKIKAQIGRYKSAIDKKIAPRSVQVNLLIKKYNSKNINLTDTVEYIIAYDVFIEAGNNIVSNLNFLQSQAEELFSGNISPKVNDSLEYCYHVSKADNDKTLFNLLRNLVKIPNNDIKVSHETLVFFEIEKINENDVIIHLLPLMSDLKFTDIEYLSKALPKYHYLFQNLQNLNVDFQPQNLNGPPVYQPQNLNGPPVFQPQNLNGPPVFQPQNLNGPPVFQPQNLNGPPVFQPQNLNGPPVFQPQNLNGPPVFTPQNLNGPPVFQPQNLNGPPADEEKIKLKEENSQLKEENRQIKSQIKNVEDEKQKLFGFLMALKNKPAKVTFYNPDDYREDSTIGEGATSCVKVVIKEEKYAKKELKSISSLKGFMRESEILFRVHHPCIIDIIGMNYGDKNHPPSLILSLEETSLETAINKDKVDNKQKCLITVEIVLGMRYIHLCGFMHRDLKPSNILLNKEYEVRISDFGLAREDDLETSQSKGIGTLRFMAPELFAEDENDESEGEKKAKYTNKVDVYSFGVTLIFIMTGKYPKFNMLKMAQGVTPILPSSISNWVRELITRCLSLSADNRPSFAEIFEIMKLNNYDLFKLSKEVCCLKNCLGI